MNTFLCCIFALIVHESGHIWASLLVGCHVKGFTYAWYGVGIVRSAHINPWMNRFVALAGPLASFVGVLVCCYAGMFEAATWQLGAATFGGALDMWNIWRRR